MIKLTAHNNSSLSYVLNARRRREYWRKPRTPIIISLCTKSNMWMCRRWVEQKFVGTRIINSLCTLGEVRVGFEYMGYWPESGYRFLRVGKKNGRNWMGAYHQILDLHRTTSQKISPLPCPQPTLRLVPRSYCKYSSWLILSRGPRLTKIQIRRSAQILPGRGKCNPHIQNSSEVLNVASRQ